MTLKKLPTDITIVTEVKCQLVDSFTRNRLKSESNSVKVPFEVGVTSVDRVISVDKPFVASITSMVFISSWSSFKIKLTNSGGMANNILCTGTFLMYGSFEEIEVYTDSVEPMRISCVYA